MWQSFTVIGRGISEITRWKKKKHHEHFISPPVTPYGRPKEEAMFVTNRHTYIQTDRVNDKKIIDS